MTPKHYSIGEFSKEIGVSVRTLHFYEELGLVIPFRTESKYRFYTAEDFGRLQMIRSLQQLGLTLKEIQAELKGQKQDLLSILPKQLAQLREKIKIESELCEKLELMLLALKDHKEVSAEELIHVLKLTQMTQRQKPERP